MEEEEETKEGEEPKAEVISGVFVNVSSLLPFSKCFTKSAFATRVKKRRQKRLKLRNIGTGN